ncbi:MAG: outer membrane lipoprotein-sorting protein [Pseudomonadota bacterium]
MILSARKLRAGLLGPRIATVAAILGAAFLFFCSRGVPANQSKPPDVEQVLGRLDDLFRSKSSVATVELSVTKPKRKHTLRMKMWTKGEDKALVVIEEPARDRGMATLKVDKNLWNYLPKISRTIRIPPSMMLSSWMGSDFTNDDLVRESSLRKDFSSRLVGRADKIAGWLIELRAKEGTVGRWQRIEYVVSEDGALPLQAMFYDRRNGLARIMAFEDVRLFGGRRIPSRMVLTPIGEDGQPEPGRRTEMRYLEVVFDADVPDNTFSLSRLERNR